MSHDLNTDRYGHLFTYVCDDVRLKRKDNADAWIRLNKANGQMFFSYPYFEFIPGTRIGEPLRFGDFVIDIDTGELACPAAIKIIDWFRDVYGVEQDQWRVYLSGKKGVHLELPAEVFGADTGHKLLTLGYKRLAKDIEGELQINLDTSMYNRGTGKPYRQPNVIRETGTCKRQVEYTDLYEIIDEETYRKSCSEPGPLWQPEEISRNKTLAEKFQYYLEEAEQQQAVIRNAPKLTPDEIDRLALSIPPCMKTLSRLTSYVKGNTFNDIAIQLTAYAVTSQMPENDFLCGCSIFIENYPSTSLNTAQKRYDNCRARFRTMAANGNQHSCGGVLALGIPGFDCNACESKIAGPQLTVAVMSEDDIQESSIMLDIPDDILDPGGLISLGMKALSAPGMPDIKQYNLAVVLTAMANAIAGKMVFRNIWPNLYNIKVGPTSSGKTSSDKAMVRAITHAGVTGFYGVTDFASGPALLRSLADNPVTMMVIDECTSMFKRYDKGDANSDGKRDSLMEVYSASGGILLKVYSDARNSIRIEYPCLSLTGNATPVIFDAIQQEDFDTGTMQRFDFWCYDGPTPRRGLPASGVNKDLNKFAKAISRIREVKPSGGNLSGLGNGRFEPFELDITSPGRDLLLAWSDDVIDRCNAVNSDGDRGIINRQFDLCIKYAMIHMAATRPIEALFLPLDELDIEYGKKVAWMLGDWKINVLRNKVTTGEFHKNCEIFKAAIKAAVKMGKRPTFAVMANRRIQMKNWKIKESGEIISVLVKRGEIVEDDSKEKTAYYLPKKV